MFLTFCSFWFVLVRQLIKSQRVQNKLGIVFEKEKDKSQRKDFIFASAKVHANTIIQNPTLMFLLKLRKHHIVCVCARACVKQKREAFCQLLQLMKNKHSNQDEPDMISIFIGTWNMGQTHVSFVVLFVVLLFLSMQM